jgi:peptide/nickel transport system substrate-binding protein
MFNLNAWRGASAYALIAGLLAVTLAACGSSGSSGGSASTSLPLKPGESTTGQQLYGKKRGGTLKVYTSEDFEHFDPGEAYFALDYAITYATQRPLYSYKPNDDTDLTPDMAAGPPSITDGAKTLTVHIRHGVHFSPPVDREVNSGDIAYAIERGANPNVTNDYFPTYFSDLVGAEHADGGPISGIETPNKYTIVFRLTKPTAPLLYGALSLPLSAPVPPEFAKPLDAHSPTLYGSEYLVATGPYMVKSDLKTGKFAGIGYQTGKSATLVRNPNWNPKTDYRPAYLNQIDINIGGEAQVIGEQVLKGQDAVQLDTPTQAIVKEAYEKYPSQIVFTPGAGDHYMSLDNAHGPFKNVNVRRAVWAAMDRDAIVKARGGPLVAQPMTHFLYPGSGGYEQAGGAAGPKLDYNEHPEGDMKVAEKYMKLAGYPSGKYTGGETLQMVSANSGNYPEIAQIDQQTLQNLGFKVHLSLVDQSTMYAKYCTVPSQNIDACPSVGWIRDFADPQAVLYVPFYGPGITPSNNSNFGQVNIPKINAAMQKAAVVVGKQAREVAWAKIDRMLVEEAVAAPEEWDTEPDIESSDVAGVSDVWDVGDWDFSFTSLK